LTLAKDNTDATTQELVVGKSSTKLEKAALDAALALKKGEVSSVVEGTQGYYIIYCVNDKEEDATQARKEVIIAKRQNRLFQKKYNIWLNKCDVNISEDFWDYFQL
jgi:parvulin-like peptidyl-prolyl isomerase